MWSLLFNFLGSGARARAIALAACLLATGCQVPQWRVGQAKVPKPAAKSAKHLEAERRAAFFIAENATEEPVKAVAEALSESLGIPEDQSFAAEIWEAAKKLIEKLRAYVVEFRNTIVDLNARLEKFDGKKIEGTGFNVFGISMSLPVLGVIAALIFFPGVAIPLLASTLKRVRGTLAAVVQGVQNYKDGKETDLDTALSKRMDAAHKMQIKKVKAKL